MYKKHRLFAFFAGLVAVFCLVYKFTPKISTFLPFHLSAFAETDVDDSDAILSYSLDNPNEHFVTIFDNGASTSATSKKVIKTDAKTVDEVLSRLNLSLASGDLISPSLESPIDANNFYINIYRSRPVLIQDGATKTIANVSTSDPLTTVRSAGFTVYDTDQITTVPVSDFLETGITSAYQIVRGQGSLVTEESEIAYQTETIRDYNLDPGVEEVRVLGEVGKLAQTFRVQTISGEVVSKELISQTTLREPVTRVVAIGTAIKNASALSVSMGRNRYTAKNLSGDYVERQETYYDLPMAVVMSYCGGGDYTVREDGAKVDSDGYILVAANLSRYPRCSVVETSLGPGKVYDTGGFAASNPEQFDLATDWTNHDGR